MDLESNTPDDHGDDRRIGRRDALKKGAIAAGVVGVVWSAPVIEGLSLAPAYGAAGSNSSVPCQGEAVFDQVIPCPAPKEAVNNIPTSGTCGTQEVVTDTHWADLTPTNANSPHPNHFDKFKINDTTGQFLLVTVSRVGNNHCKFTGVTVDSPPISQNNFFNANAPLPPWVVNPSLGTEGTGPTQTGDKIQVIYAGDPNFHQDLLRPNCQGKMHITLTCT